MPKIHHICQIQLKTKTITQFPEIIFINHQAVASRSNIYILCKKSNFSIFLEKN